jgi:hypothetical protein
MDVPADVVEAILFVRPLPEPLLVSAVAYNSSSSPTPLPFIAHVSV